jgi:citrate lyase subunit beta/citryl-CoA lyase
MKGDNNMATRRRRCELSTPAISMKMIQHAVASTADEVFLDLEDSVAPLLKDQARINVVDALNSLNWGDKVTAVRINNVYTQWCYKDIVDIVKGAREKLDVIIIPKVLRAADVLFVDILLGQLEQELGLKKRIGLECLIETAEAMEYVREISLSSPRLEAIIFGVADYSASLGIPVTSLARIDADMPYPGHRWNFALSRMAVAARTAGIQIIDGPYSGYKGDDLNTYQQQAEWSAALGYDGKWAIHPAQVPIAMKAYTPSDSVITRTSRIVEAYEKAEKEGIGALAVDGDMIDAATYKIAMKILARKG